MAVVSLPTHIQDQNESTEEPPQKCWLWDDSNNRFPLHRMLFLVASFVLYLIDIGLDVWVAVEYYIADRQGTDDYARYYLAATLFFVIVPCLIVNFISWCLYMWGWMVYRSKKLNQFCCQRLEQMKYVRPRTDSLQENTVVLVDGIHVICWSQGHKLAADDRKSSRFDHQSLSAQQSDAETVNLDILCGSSTRDKNINHKRKNSTLPILSSTYEDEDIDYEKPDNDNPKSGRTEPDGGLEFYPLDLFDSCEFFAVTLIHLCLLGYLFRILRFIYSSRKDKYSFDRYRDISFLRLIESFLESAPQLVLQLYLLVVHQEAVLWYKIVTPISIIFSICSLALAVGDYISAEKDVNHYDPHPNAEKKPRLSWPGYLMIIFWHLFMIVSRGVAFSLFATVYGAYVFIIAGLHYLAMVYWMYWQQAHVFIHGPEDFGNKLECRSLFSYKKCLFPCQQQVCSNYGIEFIAAAFNVFFHFKIKDGGAITTLIPFYFLSFVENTIMILLWYFGRDYSITVWYTVPALVTVFVSFTAGLVLLVSYYLCCQPSRKKSLEPDKSLDHPTMTSTLNRMYEMKQKRGNFFRRILGRREG